MPLARPVIVFKITDVSQDPTAPSRSRIRPEELAAARALGFEHAAWVAAVAEELPHEPTDDDVLLSVVMLRRDRGAILEMLRRRRLDDFALRTLFEDGTVVLTGRIPDVGWWKHRWGLTAAPRHAFDLKYVSARSLDDLVAIHETRVRAHVASGRRQVESHDLRAYFATRKRWREIADARVRLQRQIASYLGLASLAASTIGAVFLTKMAGAAFGEVFPPIWLLAGVLSLVFAVAIGWGAFVFSLYFVAAILARGAKAPPPRRARELLALADSVTRGWLPAPDRAGQNAIAAKTARMTATIVRTSPTELARMQRVDLVLAVTSTLVLPVAGLLGTVMFGTAAVPAVLGVVFTTDGAIALFTKRTRAELLRARFVPALVQAEGEGERVCATAACATPLVKKVLAATWLAAGLACLYSARAAVLAGSLAAPAWLVAEWGAIVFVSAFFAFTTMKKRHKRLVAA